MVRGYTTIEQSKKLLSLGLDPNTADMFYHLGESLVPNVIYGCNEDFKCYLLAWSLTALLELMPIGSHIEKKKKTATLVTQYILNLLSPVLPLKQPLKWSAG